MAPAQRGHMEVANQSLMPLLLADFQSASEQREEEEWGGRKTSVQSLYIFTVPTLLCGCPMQNGHGQQLPDNAPWTHSGTIHQPVVNAPQI